MSLSTQSCSSAQSFTAHASSYLLNLSHGNWGPAPCPAASPPCQTSRAAHIPGTSSTPSELCTKKDMGIREIGDQVKKAATRDSTQGVHSQHLPKAKRKSGVAGRAGLLSIWGQRQEDDKF